MNFRKCPICGNRILKIKYDEPEVYYYRHKSKCKKIKIYECESCKFQHDVGNSFSKSFFKEFDKLRNKSIKENIKNIIDYQSKELHMNNNATKIDLGRVLYLDKNYFQDIMENKRKITAADAALIEILFNFPFIFKCAAHNFNANKSIEFLKEFISNLENSMEINAKMRVNELLGNKG